MHMAAFKELLGTTLAELRTAKQSANSVERGVKRLTEHHANELKETRTKAEADLRLAQEGEEEERQRRVAAEQVCRDTGRQLARGTGGRARWTPQEAQER